MPVTVRFDPNVTSPQAQVIPNATPRNDGVMTKEQAALLASLNGLVGGFRYVVGPAGSGAQYTSVQAAIDAAVAAGANSGNKAGVLILPGRYAEDITSHNGVSLIGLSEEATVINGVLRGAAGAPFPIFDIANLTFLPFAVSGNGVFDPGATGFIANIENCTFDGSFAGDTPSLYVHGAAYTSKFLHCTFTNGFGDAPVVSATVDLNLTGGSGDAATPSLLFDHCLFSTISNFAAVSYDSNNNITPLAVFRDCITQNEGGTGLAVNVSSGVMNWLRGEVYWNGNAFDISATATLEILYTYFEVTTAVAACITGTVGGKLRWGGLTFRAPNSTYSDRVATTTLGAGATQMQIDAITPF